MYVFTHVFLVFFYVGYETHILNKNEKKKHPMFNVIRKHIIFIITVACVRQVVIDVIFS